MPSQKRQDLPTGTLWVVATPLGNLGDLSDRARSALMGADGILAEDTRRAQALLSALGIDFHGSIDRFDAELEAKRIPAILKRLEAGESLALISDAGTPAISDPGARLVDAVWEAGYRCVPVPGASAVATWLSIAGLPGSGFEFRGFYPRKKGERETEQACLHAIAQAQAGAQGDSTGKSTHVVLYFESPERIVESLRELAEIWPDSLAVAAKELTKTYEKIFRGPLSQVATRVSDEVKSEGARGEWVFGWVLSVEPAQGRANWEGALQCLLNAGVSASRAAREVSHVFGAARNDVYEMALSLSGKKSSPGD